MRTPEGTPNKTKNPAKLTSSYFSATKYVRQYIRPWDLTVIPETLGFFYGTVKNIL